MSILSADVSISSSFSTRSSYDMVQDTGTTLNPQSPMSNYTHGLAGVEQTGNWAVSNVTIAILGVVLALMLLYRVWDVFQKWLRKTLLIGTYDKQTYWMENQSLRWAQLKKHILYAPLWSHMHNKEIQLSKAVSVGTLPSRLLAIVLAIYVIGNVLFCVAIDWQQSKSVILAALRGRTGQLATLNLIPAILFALRNNPLIYLSGLSYDTWNLLHRWLARLVILESGLHVIFWAINNIDDGGIEQVDTSLATSTSFQWGAVAICTMCVIFLAGLSPIRHAFYDVFLASHRFLAALTLAGVYIHIEKAHLPQLPYLRLVLILWGAELAVRYFRIFWWSLDNRLRPMPVKIEALSENVCRVTFSLRRPWIYRPGCYVHAYIPSIAPWSSHPFSVAWARNTVPARSGHLSLSSDDTDTIDEFGLEKLKDRHLEEALPARTTVVDRVSLLCRARAGFTRKMFEKASSMPNKTITTWGFIEGPYGGHDQFESYGTVVLFAAGIGITHCLGHVKHLLELHAQGLCATERVVLVWSVPHHKCLDWVGPWMTEIINMTNRQAVLRVKLHVSAKKKVPKDVISSTGSVTVTNGRPKIDNILAEVWKTRIGAMAVTVCGPGAFSDSVRAEVRKYVTLGNIDFVEEAFTY